MRVGKTPFERIEPMLTGEGALLFVDGQDP